MPFALWGIFYAEVKAKELEEYAQTLTTMHPKNPQQYQRRLLQMAQMLRAGPGKKIVDDPARLARMMRSMAGVDVVTEETRGDGR